MASLTNQCDSFCKAAVCCFFLGLIVTYPFGWDLVHLCWYMILEILLPLPQNEIEFQKLIRVNPWCMPQCACYIINAQW